MSPIYIVFVVVCREFEGLAVVCPSPNHSFTYVAMGCGFVGISTSPMHARGGIDNDPTLSSTVKRWSWKGDRNRGLGGAARRRGSKRWIPLKIEVESLDWKVFLYQLQSGWDLFLLQKLRMGSCWRVEFIDQEWNSNVQVRLDILLLFVSYSCLSPSFDVTCCCWGETLDVKIWKLSSIEFLGEDSSEKRKSFFELIHSTLCW